MLIYLFRAKIYCVLKAQIKSLDFVSTGLAYGLVSGIIGLALGVLALVLGSIFGSLLQG